MGRLVFQILFPPLVVQEHRQREQELALRKIVQQKKSQYIFFQFENPSYSYYYSSMKMSRFFS